MNVGVPKHTLKDRFHRLLRLRAYKLLDTLSTHSSIQKIHSFKDQLNFIRSLKGTISLMTEMLSELNQYYPYNQILDWEGSPVILLDVDSTLFIKDGDPCHGEHCFGTPVYTVIEVINELYDYGCIIKIYTGRMNQYVLNIDRTVKPALKAALQKAGVKYHTILEIQKPNAEIILDDLAINPLI